ADHPAGVAGYSGRTLPRGGGAWLRALGDGAAFGVADAQAGGAGGGAADFLALPDEFCGGADSGGRAKGDDLGTGDLSGVPL
ncbi:MAG: hypothetical protein EBS68_15425, partial [Rhodobacteraceae bacterium]|nr:hypothetical protein [Paracoccaceae bacterium]